jgi:hypothetical protein
MKFWLGIHAPHWLATMTVPAFVSYSRLVGRKSFPRASVDWCHDSKGFTELRDHGAYRFSVEQYVAHVRLVSSEIGRMAWAAIMDWMCEDIVLQKTGLSVLEHQKRTIDNFIKSKSLAPEIPWIACLQGWEPGNYLEHVEQYAKRGIDLTQEKIVGLGSVCTRQKTKEIASVVIPLAQLGLKLHGFGVKADGLDSVGQYLESSDSMAWSNYAVKEMRCNGFYKLPEHADRKHKNCANCLEYAMWWRGKLIEPRLARIARARELQAA